MVGVGHLGELEVIDYLRKNKRHDIYTPLKDKGIDFISVGKKGFYQIQVKTSMFQKKSYFWFDLYKHKLVYSKNTYYIFCCKSLGRRKFMGKSSNFIVIPSLKLKDWITKRKIVSKKGNLNLFNIFIYPDPKKKKWIYKNKGKVIDLTSYLNNFDKLK